MPARRPPAAADVPVDAAADVHVGMRPDLPEAPRPPGALRALLRRHPLAVDVLVAVAYVVVSAFGLASTYLATGDGRPLGVDVALAVCLGASAAALLVRRRRPRATFVVIGLATVTTTVVDSGLDPLGVSLALYALAVHRSDRSAWIGLGVSVLSGGLAVALSGALHGDGTRSGVALLSPVFVLVTLVAVLVGVTVGGRRRYVAALVDRAERLAREQQQREQLAAAAERARMTREVHDIVAHGISVMVSLADGADAIADKDPRRSREAMTHIVEVGQRSLADMRRLLGATDEAGAAAAAELQPAPTLDGLPALVESYRAAGLPVVLEPRGETRHSEGVQAATYRIVQEALTNALRHAVAPEEVRVELDLGTVVRLTVTDDGRGDDADGADRHPAAGQGSGRGLLGMRERARMVGGSVEAGPVPGGGWRVHVELEPGQGTR